MSDIDCFVEFLRGRKHVTVLSGAGCSTPSGIPDYRDDDGRWKSAMPVQFSDFVTSANARKRYWARSLAGWPRFASAIPNAAHAALAELEHAGNIRSLITQNIDNLHRRAGSRRVIDLHGILDKIRCLACGVIGGRDDWQMTLQECNPHWKPGVAAYTPDGDAKLERTYDLDFRSFVVPDCPQCGGIVKPDVVFFGEAVPSQRIDIATKMLRHSDALLVVGSSLMVFSAFRFARFAHASGIPVVVINRGKTRADDIAIHKITSDCAEVLPRIAGGLAT